MIDFIPSFVKNVNREKKAKLLVSYFKDRESMLDFGCGDLSVSSLLKEKNNSLKITGVDIVKLKNIPNNISFVCYGGKRLPFRNNTFDTVFAFYVLHHCNDAKGSFNECLRVAKKRVIVIESVARFPMETKFMSVVDKFYNLWKPESISSADQFLTLKEWNKIFKNSKINKTIQRKIAIMPQPFFLPFGASYLFELIKK